MGCSECQTTSIKKGSCSAVAFFSVVTRTSDFSAGSGHCNYKLQNNDFLSLWAFLTLCHSELYTLAFLQSFETRAGDFAEVSENVWT